MIRPAFTILLPVHRPPALLPYAIASVQAQTRQDFELFIICDGAPPETAMCAREFAANDERIQVFEHPKGEHHGELYRDQALRAARGEYVCHIGDDDLWLPNFLTEMAILLQDADFGNLAHVEVLPNGTLNLLPGNLADETVRSRMMSGPNNFFGLSLGGYRLSAYRALPVGWTPSPPGVSSDLHLWRKFLSCRDLRFGTRIAVCALKFAAGRRGEQTLDQRVEEIAGWAKRLSQHGSLETISQTALLQLSQTAYNLRLHAENLKKAGESTGHELRGAQRRLDKAHHKLRAIRRTLSWRLTRPFRRLARFIAP